MKHSITDDRRKLIITITPDEQAALRETIDTQSDSALAAFLEPLTCNSELDWVNPGDTGDLTDAPMLGILGQEQPEHFRHAFPPHYGIIPTGTGFIAPILERWAFIDYQVRSVLQDLRDNGKVVFTNGE